MRPSIWAFWCNLAALFNPLSQTRLRWSGSKRQNVKSRKFQCQWSQRTNGSLCSGEPLGVVGVPLPDGMSSWAEEAARYAACFLSFPCLMVDSATSVQSALILPWLWLVRLVVTLPFCLDGVRKSLTASSFMSSKMGEFQVASRFWSQLCVCLSCQVLLLLLRSQWCYEVTAAQVAQSQWPLGFFFQSAQMNVTLLT